MQNNNYTSFDGKNDTFQKNIYLTSKGQLRREILKEDLDEILTGFAKQSLNILDLGCGDGFFAAYLADLGHHLTICDVSKEALDQARSRLAQTDAKIYQANLLDLPSGVTSEHYDLIICHAVLEWISDPLLCLQSIGALMDPHTLLSLCYYNRDALLFHSLLMGNFAYVDANLKSRHKQKMTPTHPVSPRLLDEIFATEGFEIRKERGIRCFHDYMRDVSMQQTHFVDIARLEKQYSQDPRFVRLGRYIHVVLQKI